MTVAELIQKLKTFPNGVKIHAGGVWLGPEEIALDADGDLDLLPDEGDEDDFLDEDDDDDEEDEE